MQTLVTVKCVSKKETINWDPEHPVATEIEFQVPYDQNSIFWKLSGGTDIKLNTINQSAADMFTLGGSFDIVISATPTPELAPPPPAQ